MKKIKLKSERYRRRFAIVDDSDFETINKYVWYANTCHKSKVIYAIRFEIDDKGRRRSIRMHREILGASRGIHVDHVDGNGLNNQRCNLRACTSQQNCRNAAKHKSGTSFYKGVVYNRRSGFFIARIWFEKKSLNLGNYRDENSAAEAYNAAASRLFGEFARLNEIRASNRIVSVQICSSGILGNKRSYAVNPA
jgi:hypothetical protein